MATRPRVHGSRDTPEEHIRRQSTQGRTTLPLELACHGGCAALSVNWISALSFSQTEHSLLPTRRSRSSSVRFAWGGVFFSRRDSCRASIHAALTNIISMSFKSKASPYDNYCSTGMVIPSLCVVLLPTPPIHPLILPDNNTRKGRPNSNEQHRAHHFSRYRIHRILVPILIV